MVDTSSVGSDGIVYVRGVFRDGMVVCVVDVVGLRELVVRNEIRRLLDQVK